MTRTGDAGYMEPMTRNPKADTKMVLRGFPDDARRDAGFR